jgi:hypothetical protein
VSAHQTIGQVHVPWEEEEQQRVYVEIYLPQHQKKEVGVALA